MLLIDYYVEDHMLILNAAESGCDATPGKVVFSALANQIAGYDQTRFQRSIKKLLDDGMAWEDEQNHGEVAYWFPVYMASGQSMDLDLNSSLLNAN